jgi:2-amino-4-hydroxy-6-hydroxymethyldihydropteridine diphosphokinase
LVIFVGIGANLPSATHGSPLATCSAAIGVLDLRGVIVIRRSRWYITAPVPPSKQSDYINGVLQVDTELLPEALLRVLHDVERAFGRSRGKRNADRTLDLDLLAYGNVTMASGAAVEVPHPRMHERAFVLLPLQEIAPDTVIPGRGRAAAWLAACAGQGVSVLPPPAAAVNA